MKSLYISVQSLISQKTFFTKEGSSPQILRKIFRRYIHSKMSQKISSTAKP